METEHSEVRQLVQGQKAGKEWELGFELLEVLLWYMA
jgi:hypothetical protein